jgi:hypothetical protein
MKTEHVICLAVPENADHNLINTVINGIRKHDAFSHYSVHILELPHDRGAVFNHKLTDAFVEKSRQYDTLAFLAFPDGGIHSTHGQAITDRWRRQHDSRVYQISKNGDVTAREPMHLFDQFLSPSQTLDHVWDNSQHYMLPLQ